MNEYSYDRRASNLEGSEDFIELMKRLLNIGDRQIRFDNKSTLGGLSYETVFINYYNIPKGSGGSGGGAEAENNRMMFQGLTVLAGQIHMLHPQPERSR